jgi:hypothetical protein
MGQGIGPAFRRANTRIAALQAQLAQDLTAGDELWLIRYGIKQVAIDPGGYLRMMRHTDEAETLATAELYAAIHAHYAEYVFALIDISSDLRNDEH